MEENKIIKFAHFSDSHLGRFLNQNETRYIDMFKGFRDALKISINQEPPVEFIIITGDLFQNPQPNTRTYKEFFKLILKALKKLPNLKIFLIPGNHEFKESLSTIKNRYGLSLIEYSRFYENLILIQDDIYCFERREDLQPVLIYGVRYYRKDSLFHIKELINNEKSKNLNEKNPNAIKILMIHQYTSGMQELGFSPELDENELRFFNFDYIGVGHNHSIWEKPQLKLYCSGSTEHLSRREWPKNDELSECYVIINELIQKKEKWILNTNKMAFPVRTKQEIIINLGKISYDEAYEDVKKGLQEKVLEEACVYVEINGCFSIEEERYFDISTIRNEIKEEKKLVEIEIINNVHLDTGQFSDEIKGKQRILEEIISQILKIPEKEQDYYIHIFNQIEESAETLQNNEDIDQFLDNIIE